MDALGGLVLAFSRSWRGRRAWGFRHQPWDYDLQRSTGSFARDENTMCQAPVVQVAKAFPKTNEHGRVRFCSTQAMQEPTVDSAKTERCYFCCSNRSRVSISESQERREADICRLKARHISFGFASWLRCKRVFSFHSITGKGSRLEDSCCFCSVCAPCVCTKLSVVVIELSWRFRVWQTLSAKRVQYYVRLRCATCDPSVFQSKVLMLCYIVTFHSAHVCMSWVALFTWDRMLPIRTTEGTNSRIFQRKYQDLDNPSHAHH